MNGNVLRLKNKLNSALEKLGGIDEISRGCAVFGRYCAFVSVSGGSSRAKIFRAAADTAREAFEKAASLAEKYIERSEISPRFVKLDFAKNGSAAPLSDVKKEIKRGHAYFFRKGISADKSLDNALCEVELNINPIISYKEKTVSLPDLNRYFAKISAKPLEKLPDELVTFEFASAFSDDSDEAFELYGAGYCCGRRLSDGCSKQSAREIVVSAGEYLCRRTDAAGEFQYGVYPLHHKLLPGYNILRHASSIWSMLCSYRLSGDEKTLLGAKRAIEYLTDKIYRKYIDFIVEENAAFVIEETKLEVKVGGNAVAIILLCEYADLTGDERYKKLTAELANGILELFDDRDGSFFHVLKYPTLMPKDKFRTVYYDGEAVFALCRAYSLTKNDKYLAAAKLAANRFIKLNYEKYCDHWTAYAMNELTKYDKSAKYVDFGLKVAGENLDKIYAQPTTYHTYLELLCVVFGLVWRVKAEALPHTYKIDEKKLAQTILHRADFMQNGLCLPEFTMYFKEPSDFNGAFFIRQDAFRIRIDDVQHFCGGYYLYHKYYDEIKKLAEE